MYSDYAPRKRDEKKWSENYDRIFGKKKSEGKSKETDKKKDENKSV